MSKTVLQTLKGFRDFLPEQKRKRDYVTKKVIEIFERFGFEPLDTPTLEYASLLLGKYGNEADKLVYSFKDRGNREVALRYDQTVPTARILSQYQQILPKYFRRYEIQNVFRADKPQQGRYREFTQCDIDIFNSTSPIADAEILAATYFAFKNVGYPEIILLINHRAILFELLNPFVSDTLNVFSLIQTIDKLEKIGSSGVSEELQKKGLSSENAKQAVSNVENARNTSDNLKSIIASAEKLGIPKNALKFTPHLARGLDYYTGMIYEVILPGYTGGSCGGGGRYDKLIGQLGGVEVPAVGIAFGFDRMVEAAEYFKVIPEDILKQPVLVTIFEEGLLNNSLRLANNLRQKGLRVEVFPEIVKLDKQLKYANKKGIQNVLILGPEEVKSNTVKLKDMKTGEQTTETIENVIKKLTD